MSIIQAIFMPLPREHHQTELQGIINGNDKTVGYHFQPKPAQFREIPQFICEILPGTAMPEYQRNAQ